MIRRESSDESAARFLAMRRRAPRRRSRRQSRPMKASTPTTRTPIQPGEVAPEQRPHVCGPGCSRDRFKVGDRVVLSSHGYARGIAKHSGRGVVVGFPTRGWRTEHCIRIKRDGIATPGLFSACFWDLEPAPVSRQPMRLRPKAEALIERGLLDRRPVTAYLADIFGPFDLGPGDPEALR